MSAEPPIRIESVEHLVGILGEAAEVEHGLMCCYLYAVYGLKTRPEDGLDPAQLEAVRRWRQSILSVAIEEMAHLALVSNLLAALGARPHLSRQNFPVSPGYHPADITVALAPFDRDTLDHFIFLERPEGVEMPDAASFAPPRRYRRGGSHGHFTPVAQDFATVGHLYREIGKGIAELAASVGEKALFCGHRSAQVGPDLVNLPGLVVVTDLASAQQAIDNIVEQGEGAPGHTEDSHYARFLAIKQEYEAILERDPHFTPSRPIARNPVMRRPPNPENRVYVEAPAAAATLDVANALYNQMLRCLAQAYGRADGDKSAQSDLVDAAIGLMGVMTPIAEALTTMPASEHHPGIHAGMTFATLRGLEPFIEGPSEWRNLARRMEELAGGVRHLADLVSGTDVLAQSLDAMAKRFIQRLDTPQASTTAPAPAMPATPPPSNGIEIAIGEKIEIAFETKRCIHARQCVLGAPGVFLANTPGEWIFPDRMDAEKLVAVAENCPSGAIQYRRRDSRPEEAPPPVNVLNVRENGPLAVRAEILLDGKPHGNRVTLCRCGQSKNKPFCDGSHATANFIATGEPATGDITALAVRNGPLAIAPQHNGPYKVTGNLEICAGTGHTVARTTQTVLCRCGHSKNKPFCDGSHRAAGFRSDV